MTPLHARVIQGCFFGSLFISYDQLTTIVLSLVEKCRTPLPSPIKSRPPFSCLQFCASIFTCHSEDSLKQRASPAGRVHGCVTDMREHSLKLSKFRGLSVALRPYFALTVHTMRPYLNLSWTRTFCFPPFC